MKRILLAALAALALAGCGGSPAPAAATAAPTPVVPVEDPNSAAFQDDVVTSQVAGPVFAGADPNRLVTLGHVVCDGWRAGVPPQDLITALSLRTINGTRVDRYTSAEFVAESTKMFCSEFSGQLVSSFGGS